jgi:Mg-chelatase subunit ChlD
MDTEELVDFIKAQLSYPGGDTNTTGALEMAKNRMYGTDGDRAEVSNVVVLLTDGIPTYPQPNPRYTFASFSQISFSILIL